MRYAQSLRIKVSLSATPQLINMPHIEIDYATVDTDSILDRTKRGSNVSFSITYD